MEQMSNDTVVGIDLGTTNSSVALLREGVPEVITDGDDGLVPSCVAWDPARGIFVGREARNQAVVFPERTVLSIKRRMGTTERLGLGGDEYSPQQLSAFILEALAGRARKILDCEISRAVITVPAYFTDAQRKATREAGELAGLNVERIINEPTAASLVYDAGTDAASKILVYDLGGGTFDVSVVAVEKGVVEVLATAGNNRLGGDDFDALIVKRLLDHLEERTGDTTLRTNRTVQARLLHAAEAAKRELSSAPFAAIEEDNLPGSRGKMVNLSFALSRAAFEKDIGDLLEGTLQEVSKALNDAGVGGRDLDRVLLVGGSTRIPLVSKMLKKRLGMAPHGEVDPDRCVALGAAMQAGLESGLDVKAVLVDITPYTFGTRVLGDLDDPLAHFKFVPIIPRNSKLPVTKSDVFYTVFPDQEGVDVEIYQGDDPDVRNNTRIVSVAFQGLNKNSNAYNEGIVFTYSLNIDGILEFSARERKTGKEVSGKIEDALGVRPGIDEPQVLDPLYDGRGPSRDSGRDSTAHLLRRAQAALANAPEEDLVEIQRLIRELRRASRRGRSAKIEQLAGELAELLFFIE